MNLSNDTEDMKAGVETFRNVNKRKKFGIAGVDRPQKSSWCSIHFAASKGHLECAEVLVDYKADCNKPLNTTFEKMTPLMLAAAKDDLKMAKYLVQTGKAKIEKPDKFKKTALVHAVMNGCTKVASYLLAMGANPNKMDTSNNTCLHYSCAYGWFHTTSMLINAGALPLDPPNEWGMTPLAICILQGNIGLAKHLLTLPGIDINGRDEKGLTILLHMMYQSINTNRELTEELFSEVRELIEVRGAKADASDHCGKNILHYLTAFSPKMSTPKEDTKGFQLRVIEQAKLQKRFVQYFIQEGCDSLKTDENGVTPVAACIAQRWEDNLRWKNYEVINVLLDDMNLRLKKQPRSLGGIFVHSTGDGVLNEFARSFNLIFVDREREILGKIIRLISETFSVDNPLQRTDMQQIIESRLGNKNYISTNLETYKTPIIQLCRSYSKTLARNTVPDWDSKLCGKEHPLLKYYGLYYDPARNIKGYDEMWEKARELICDFIRTLKPKLFYEVTTHLNKDGIHSKPVRYSALLAIMGTENTNEPKEKQITDKSDGRIIAANTITSGRPGFDMLLNIIQDPDRSKFSSVHSNEVPVQTLVREMIDCCDINGRTALIRAVCNGHEDLCRILISFGADVDFAYDIVDPIMPESTKDDTTNSNLIIVKNEDGKAIEILSKKSCALMDVIKNIDSSGNTISKTSSAEAKRDVYLNILDLLIQSKVNLRLNRCTSVSKKTGSEFKVSLLLESVKSCLSNRYCRSRKYMLKKLIQSGLDVNCSIITAGDFSCNALHISVNKTTGDANQSLDLETTLLRSGCSPLEKDSIGRYPLHYCFVKQNKESDSSFSDPIEVCSMLVEAMEGEKALDSKDKFGGTPLMYAAYRGATVCCLLLIEKGKANVNDADKFGNTPLVYAVLGKHDGCTAMLLQKGANVNTKIYPNPKIKYKNTSTKNICPNEIPTLYKYLPSHFKECMDDKWSDDGYTLFEGIVRNGWLGITYLALDQMERFGMLYANAIEVAFHISKLQFAKTLINKQATPKKLLAKVTDGRNLICALSFEMNRRAEVFEEKEPLGNCSKNQNWGGYRNVAKKSEARNESRSGGCDAHIMEDILDMLVEAGVSLYEPDVHGCTPFHYACLRHNLPLIKYIIAASKSKTITKQNIFKVKDNHGRSPLISAFWDYSEPHMDKGVVKERPFLKVLLTFYCLQLLEKYIAITYILYELLSPLHFRSSNI